MVRTLLTLLCTAPIFLLSCSDETETAYTGPWEIVYEEVFNGPHKDSPEFRKWFNKHRSGKMYFDTKLHNGNLWTQYSIAAEEFHYSDYDKLIWGNIIWVETIEQATEQEMQALVDEFKAFAEPEDKNGNYKICTAFYKKYIQTK